MMNLFRKTSEVAQVLPGYPFRGKIEADQGGNACVVQMRNVSPIGGINWSSLIRVNVDEKKHSAWLKQGDIIFAARGANNYAVHVEAPAPNTVLSPHFFLIRTETEAEILPEFLAWQINQAPAKKYFTTASEGSVTVSIRKTLLESLLISTPSIEEQHKVIKLLRCWKKQQRTIHELECNNKKLMMGIANLVFNKTTGQRMRV